MNRITCVNLVGRAPAFLELVDMIRRVAGTDAPVLIEGETGTGKEMVARAIHYGSERQSRPFVPVNCGAIPEHLIENELFGHVRGAYTDARDTQPGLIGLANGGTLFLDEVDALTPKGQVTLLRFLQDLNYRPLGARREEHADVRIVAATNADLAERVSDKRFRIDLYYRLQILSLHLPPLRERSGDPELLASHFSRQLGARYGGVPKQLDADSVELLNRYRWPGNVRELENVIHREFLLADGDRIRIAPTRLPGAVGSTSPLVNLTVGWSNGMPFVEAKARCIQQFERSFLSHALSAANGNVSAAARLCGKERRAFGRLLKRYGIDRSTFAGTDTHRAD